MKKLSKILLTVVLVSSAILVASCGKSDDNKETDTKTTEETSKSTEDTTKDAESSAEPEKQKLTTEELDAALPIINDLAQLPQLTEVKEGETIAVIKTSMGDITIRFFDQYAPKSVENFLTLAKDGYYNGTVFHRVINDFVVQGGDPTATGGGGESIYGAGGLEDEISPYLKHFSGAVAMANAGPNTNGSQFYIVENDQLSSDDISYLQHFKENPNEIANVDAATNTEIENQRYVSPTVAEQYLNMGGLPSLDYRYTVFGQVISGMDVVHAIGEVETYAQGEGQTDKPKTDVIVNSIEVTQYKK